eukprot:152434-Prymnesium_polylepis.1
MPARLPRYVSTVSSRWCSNMTALLAWHLRVSLKVQCAHICVTRGGGVALMATGSSGASVRLSDD